MELSSVFTMEMMGKYADMYTSYFIYSIIWSTCALWILSSPAHSYTYCCLVFALSNSQCGSLFLLVSLLSCGLIAQKTTKVSFLHPLQDCKTKPFE